MRSDECLDLWTPSVGVLAPEECLDLFRNLLSIYHAMASLSLENDPLSTGFAVVLSGFSVGLASFAVGLESVCRWSSLIVCI